MNCNSLLLWFMVKILSYYPVTPILAGWFLIAGVFLPRIHGTNQLVATVSTSLYTFQPWLLASLALGAHLTSDLNSSHHGWSRRDLSLQLLYKYLWIDLDPLQGVQVTSQEECFPFFQVAFDIDVFGRLVNKFFIIFFGHKNNLIGLAFNTCTCLCHFIVGIGVLTWTV